MHITLPILPCGNKLHLSCQARQCPIHNSQQSKPDLQQIPSLLNFLFTRSSERILWRFAQDFQGMKHGDTSTTIKIIEKQSKHYKKQRIDLLFHLL